MVYGLTYLDRITDFIEIADAYSASVVVFKAYWAERFGKAYVEGDGSECWFVDCYELGFMGAFGIGYKIIVQGEQHISRGDTLENQELAKQSKVVQDFVLRKWHQVWNRQPMQRKDFKVRPGVLFELTIENVVPIDMDSFLKDKVPRTAVVLLNTRSTE